MGVRCKTGSGQIRPLRIKCTRQRPDHVNEKRRLGRATSIIATNRKQGGTADGTGTEIGTCLTKKWRAKINQEGLYNVKVNAPKERLEKMAKNQSLPARLQENDS